MGRSVKKRVIVAFAVTGGLILVVTLLPVVITLASPVVAGALGCRISLESIQPCWVGGLDYGTFLTGMFVSGVYIFFTLPAGVVMALIWFIALSIYLLAYFKDAN